jgi:D-lactate dehydratase
MISTGGVNNGEGANHVENASSKAVIAISSFNRAIYPGGHQTGLFLTEALRPYEVFVAAGFEVDLASEAGTFGFDFNSLTPPFLSGSDRAVYNDPNHPFMVDLKLFSKER